MNKGSETQVSLLVTRFKILRTEYKFSMSVALRSTEKKKNHGYKARNYIYLSIIKLDLGVAREYQFGMPHKALLITIDTHDFDLSIMWTYISSHLCGLIKINDASPFN